MSKYRTPSKKAVHYIPKEEYLAAIRYSLCYPIWKEEVADMANTARAITYDKDKVECSPDYDSTFEAAVRIQHKQHKINLIDDTIKYVANGMDSWLRLGVCYGLTFNQLKGKGMPCEDKKYYRMRRAYYYYLSQKM